MSGPFVLGLTGAIGMGKTQTAAVFSMFGVPVFDSDGAVHALLAPGGQASKDVAVMFPHAVVDGVIDRKKLGSIVFKSAEKLHSLEAILHPLVEDMQKQFIATHARRRTKAVVLDIPLLFETGSDVKTDMVACVYAPGFVQRPRVLARPGMDDARMTAIENNQFSGELKCQLADYVISTRAGRAESLRQVRELVKIINNSSANVWGPHWGRN